MSILISFLAATFALATPQSVGSLPGQTIGSKAKGLTVSIRPDGSLSEMNVRYPNGWQRVEFRNDNWRGPGFGTGLTLQASPRDTNTFETTKFGVSYRIHYEMVGRGLKVTATVENGGTTPFAPDRLPFQLGIDTFMDRSPRWNDQFFPTFFRCEATHMSGYLMTPNGRILGITSPDPVGSYSLEYQREMYAHFIYTVSLDLLQKGKVPDHQAPYLPLAPGERRSWSINLSPIDTISAIPHELAKSSNAPFVDIDRASLEPNQPADIQVATSTEIAKIEVTDPGGSVDAYGPRQPISGVVALRYPKTHEYGTYLVRSVGLNGKVATGSFYVHPNWSWYLKQARLEALRLTPRADLVGGADEFSCETHYGLLGFHLASKHFPDPAIDRKGDRILEKVLTRLYRYKDGQRFSGNAERVQNGTAMISILVLRYQATGDVKSLEMASEFAEFVLQRQAAQGYYGGYGMAPYTAVLYPAKSLMELMAAVKPLAAKDQKWSTRYNRWYLSVSRAMADLIHRGKDVKTEGGATFEDGAVSCTALQLGAFALLQTDAKLRKHYADAARKVLDSHSCLTRLMDPDARSRGATSRFWEAWGDVHIPAQMMLSPHGWSGWRLYAEYYLYLLTGEEDYLRNTFDALGACTQLIDWPSGRLRYAFVVDPNAQAGEWLPDAAGISRYVEGTISEQYLRTIGDHFGVQTKGKNYLDRVEWSWVGDGPPFEIFKAMEEISATRAFVFERSDHSLLGYNCDANWVQGKLQIRPHDRIVNQIHLNLKSRHEVKVLFADKSVSESVSAGMSWLTSAK